MVGILALLILSGLWTPEMSFPQSKIIASLQNEPLTRNSFDMFEVDVTITYNTECYSFMDEITDYINKSILSLELNEITPYDLNDVRYTYDIEYFTHHRAPDVVNFKKDGSYFIHISWHEIFCDEPQPFKFDYNGLHFKGPQQLNSFFTEFKKVEIEEYFDIIIPPGEYRMNIFSGIL